jgi:hypothetical protein
VVGATVEEDFLALFRDAGFEDVEILRRIDYFAHSPSTQTREIAAGANAAVVFVDYERSPEARYPVAIEQAYVATEHVAGIGRGRGVEPTRLAIWDIEGQAGNRPNFYLGAQAVVLVYDVTEPGSLQALSEWYARCQKYARTAPIIVAGNKVDLGLAFPPTWGRALAHFIGGKHGFLSAKTGQNVSRAFDLLGRARAVAHNNNVR